MVMRVSLVLGLPGTKLMTTAVLPFDLVMEMSPEVMMVTVSSPGLGAVWAEARALASNMSAAIVRVHLNGVFIRPPAVPLWQCNADTPVRACLGYGTARTRVSALHVLIDRHGAAPVEWVFGSHRNIFPGTYE